ncbi:MAG: cell division protein ZapA [Bacteroidia bacterium]
MNELSIHINIASRAYPLIINSNDEATVRQAGKLINDKLQVFYEQFSIKDNQDALAMFALQFVTDYLKEKEQQAIASTELNRQLQKANNLLSIK